MLAETACKKVDWFGATEAPWVGQKPRIRGARAAMELPGSCGDRSGSEESVIDKVGE